MAETIGDAGVDVKKLLAITDWFIPHAGTIERSELSLGRNFVSTHILGPLVSQSISVMLLRTDPNPGIAAWTIVVCVCLFWTLPFFLKFSGSLQLASLISVELLAFTSLFGAFHYGGVSSPFLPWLIISLMLGFFYLSDRPFTVIALFVCNITCFYLAYLCFDFSSRIPSSALATVGWISIFSATTYMSWMAVFYASLMSMRSKIERETERHRQTSQRLNNAKNSAEKANWARSIFLAKMSHELRTPLNAVIGYSEILLETCDLNGGASAKRQDLERINSAGKHLLSLVDDVLDLSKIESNLIEVKIDRFNLDRLFDEIATTAQHLAAAKSNRFMLTKFIGLRATETLGSMTTDATKLRQIMLNLVSNAAKFTDRGSISVIVRRETRANTDWIEIQVRDNGIGIAGEYLSRLFHDFAQASSQTSGLYGGTGLGLAISQKLCALMGGGINVTSEAGKGSCFTVTLPELAVADDDAVRAAA